MASIINGLSLCLTDYTVLIKIVDAPMRPRVFIRHFHVAGHRGAAESNFRIGKLETTTRARQRNVKRLAIELVDDRPAATFQDAWYVDRSGPELLARFKMNG